MEAFKILILIAKSPSNAVGKADHEEIMLDTLARYKEPGLKELTDGTFEHKTEAATATACDVVHPMLVMLLTMGWAEQEMENQDATS